MRHSKFAVADVEVSTQKPLYLEVQIGFVGCKLLQFDLEDLHPTQDVFPMQNARILWLN